MNREKAAAAIAVALLHVAALLFFLHPLHPSTAITPSKVRVAAALPQTEILVSLEPIESPAPAKRGVAHRPSAAPEREVETRAMIETISVAPALVPILTPASAAVLSHQNTEASMTTDAAYLKNPPPQYPAASLRRREEGRVLVAVLISEQGFVNTAQVALTSGFPRLDEAAVAAVRTWRFVPATRAGIAVEARTNVPVRFELSAD